jgi:hypothetical protein
MRRLERFSAVPSAGVAGLVELIIRGVSRDAAGVEEEEPLARVREGVPDGMVDVGREGMEGDGGWGGWGRVGKLTAIKLQEEGR